MPSQSGERQELLHAARRRDDDHALLPLAACARKGKSDHQAASFIAHAWGK